MECSDILSIYHALGMLELNCNNISAARLNFHQGIKLSMQSALSLREHALPFLLHSLGTLELNSNRIDEAKRVFVRALSLFPNQPQLLLGLASSEMKLGRYEEARSFFQDSVKADPLHAQAWFVSSVIDNMIMYHHVLFQQAVMGTCREITVKHRNCANFVSKRN